LIAVAPETIASAANVAGNSCSPRLSPDIWVISPEYNPRRFCGRLQCAAENNLLDSAIDDASVSNLAFAANDWQGMVPELGTPR